MYEREQPTFRTKIKPAFIWLPPRLPVLSPTLSLPSRSSLAYFDSSLEAPSECTLVAPGYTTGMLTDRGA